jgi:hypothetical protein
MSKLNTDLWLGAGNGLLEDALFRQCQVSTAKLNHAESTPNGNRKRLIGVRLVSPAAI